MTGVMSFAEMDAMMYKIEGEDLYLKVSDNGLGMTEEQVARLFSDTPHTGSSRGSGIGVKKCK